MFKGAESFNGFDAWRRGIRMIDDGLPLQLKGLRDEVRAIHLRPIKDLEGVDVGIAEFDETIRRYHGAVGTGWEEPAELK